MLYCVLLLLEGCAAHPIPSPRSDPVWGLSPAVVPRRRRVGRLRWVRRRTEGGSCCVKEQEEDGHGTSTPRVLEDPETRADVAYRVFCL